CQGGTGASPNPVVSYGVGLGRSPDLDSGAICTKDRFLGSGHGDVVVHNGSVRFCQPDIALHADACSGRPFAYDGVIRNKISAGAHGVNDVRLNTIRGTGDGACRDYIPVYLYSPADLVYRDRALRDVPYLVPRNMDVRLFVGGFAHVEHIDRYCLIAVRP